MSTAKEKKEVKKAEGDSKIPEVDAEISKSHEYMIVKDDNGKYYSAYLMKSDCDLNNNKYYIIQLLKNVSTNVIILWTRYGRVGRTGGSNKEVMPTIESGIQAYEKTYASKTSRTKGYQQIEMKLGKEAAYEEVNITKKAEQPKSVGYADSSLDKRLQELIQFINDKDMMEKSVT